MPKFIFQSGVSSRLYVALIMPLVVSVSAIVRLSFAQFASKLMLDSMFSSCRYPIVKLLDICSVSCRVLEATARAIPKLRLPRGRAWLTFTRPVRKIFPVTPLVAPIFPESEPRGYSKVRPTLVATRVPSSVSVTFRLREKTPSGRSIVSALVSVQVSRLSPRSTFSNLL